MKNKKCEMCQKEFVFNENLKRERAKRFCSSFCAKSHNGKNNKGKKRTEDQKKIMSKNKMGHKNHFFGKSHSIESIRKISEKALKRSNNKKKVINMSTYEKEVLDGMLLADASIGDPSSISARITYGCKFKETLDDIISELSSVDFGKSFSYTSKPHKKTGKKYTNWFLNSNKNHTLLLERDRWYPNGVKIVPEDILVTKNSCYWWFIGDGYVSEGNVHLCTDSFSKEDILNLIKKLDKEGFSANLTSKNRIYINKKSSVKFMNWISEGRKISNQYQYKWDNFNEQRNEKNEK